MIFDLWAKKWGVSNLAIEDFKIMCGIQERVIIDKNSRNEAQILAQVKLEASSVGARLWRNNVGAAQSRTGRTIRFGLANDSGALNSVLKSADLIGIRPLYITAEYLGLTIGQFVSREIKSSDWEFKGSEREKAQIRWMGLILSLGGDACFARGEGTFFD